MALQDYTLFIYNISLLPIIFFSVLFAILTFISLFSAKKEKKYPALENVPFVTVQIPTFNDPVAERCIRHCLGFNYPKDKYEIIIADDSTNTGTIALLSGIAEKNRDMVKFFHRNSREGFKAGALKEAMPHSKGEIVVIFDADWMPNESFLNDIVKPFSDEKVAAVQTKQGFYNKDANLIARFASYLLMIYHTIIMPINNRLNCVFFCGTAGAIRRKHFEEVGGWNLKSITEDSDLTVNLLLKGYRTVYLDIETPSEVPVTFEGFIRQQMRWCYGNARVFFDNAFKILLKRGLTVRQRLMILFVTIGNAAAPIVLLMTFFGFLGWFTGEPKLMTFSDLIEMSSRIALTAGFLFIGAVTLYKRKELKDFPYFILASLTMGIVLAAANTIAFFKAAFNRKLSWFCTPKEANTEFV
ncbi:glycosyltransferase [Candidatus Woesearchaeota archaeon]|nr:glycosyltransferase [Candidatus Woesearchaeota archaeon]